MLIFENDLYIEDLNKVVQSVLPWQKLKNKTVLLSGATGLIGSCFVDCIMEANKQIGLECTVIAIGRDIDKAKNRFSYCFNDRYFNFIVHDINDPINCLFKTNIDFILHMASNTHPISYAMNPIETITTNIFGTYNLLEFALRQEKTRIAFISSTEIYGENRGDVELFDEKYCGYIDCNTMRAGYPESKRCSEALCQAFIKQKGLDIVIPRLPRTYGPTMLMSDSKALSQFIKKGLKGEDIVLKSEGKQLYSYSYVFDVVFGIIMILLNGEKGEAYNIADKNSDISLRELAQLIADYTDSKIIFKIPDEIERSGYSTATKAKLCSSKIKKLGWNPHYNIKEGVYRTLEILKQIY